MKKLFSYIIPILFFSSIVFSLSCSRILRQPNLNAFSAAQIWDDSALANAYVANLYNVFGNYNVGADEYDDQQSGLLFPPNAITTTNAGPLSDWGTTAGSAPYSTIRLINLGIEDVQKGTLPQWTKNEILGQLYFLRAYAYFPMINTYGGVPYLRTAQSQNDSLNIPRNSTLECFNFMIQDIDSALLYLPIHILPSSSNYGKIDGDFALAFKAKVLLYEASPQFNPANPWDNTYWQQAYSANLLAYDSLVDQGYSLFPNYSQIASTPGNSGVVFCVINTSPNKTAGWDNGVRPGTLSRSEAFSCPTWEMVKAFPMLDGKAYNDPTGEYYQNDSAFLQDYWKNRDPRFTESVVYNAALYPVAGTPAGYRQYTSLGIANSLDAFGINPNAGVPAAQNNNVYTGFFILKNSDLNLTQAQVTNYAYPYIVMRFAEVMMDYAETANETGHTQDAINILHQIRQRAGILQGADGSYGITAATRMQVRQAIMNERNIEFCFEGMRFNDLRRWRMLNLLNNLKHGVEAIATNPDGSQMAISQAQQLASTNQLVPSNFQYVIRQVPMNGVLQNVVPNTYYFAPIPATVIAAQSNIQQNVGWGGTFDPTLH